MKYKTFDDSHLLMTNFTRMKCYECGWVSAELTPQQVSDLGVPWYCAYCGENVKHFIKYSDSERDDPKVLKFVGSMLFPGKDKKL